MFRRFSTSFAAASTLPLLLIACDGTQTAAVAQRPDAAGPNFTAPPQVVANPNPAAPLTAVLSASTDVPTFLALRIDDGQGPRRVVAEEAFGTTHANVPVIGLRPGVPHTLEVVAVDVQGQSVVSAPIAYTPPPLPSNFPPLATTVSDPQRMEPGFTLLSLFSSRNDSFLIMLDDAGEVVWYLDGNAFPHTGLQQFVGDARFDAEGRKVLWLAGRKQAFETDLFGNTLEYWYAGRIEPQPPAAATLVDVDTFHHELRPLPPGLGADFVTLGTDFRPMTNYPTSVVNPAQTQPTGKVIGDTIVEFRRDGTVVREILLLDVLDPYRVSYDSLGNFWNATYERGDTEDWAHANAVDYDAQNDLYIVSLRHQDAIVALDRQTTAIRWILGSPYRWVQPWQQHLLTPVGAPFEWSYHPHAPCLTSSGTLMVFDNGNGRAIPPDPEFDYDLRYSRAVEYEVDPVAMTVRQVWAHGGPQDPSPPFYSFFLGDADPLPVTGNVLVTDGGKQVSATDPTRWARIAEVTRATPPQLVFEVEIRDDVGQPPVGYSVYRSQRVPSLYPRL